MHRWTLQQLRLFEAVARHRSYTRAAEELHLSQPAVSIQLKRLEGSIGLPLFEQVGKKLFLTRAGEEVYAAASEVVARLKYLAGAVTDMKGMVAGPLQIAVVTSAKFFMPHFLGRFLREHPEVQPQLTVTNRARVLERLAANQDDFVVMGQIPEHLVQNAQPFMENRLVPIAHPDHPLVKESTIPLQRFSSERFLMREAGSGTRAITERLFTEHGLLVKPYMELGSSEAIKQGVMAGLGVSVLSTSSLALELETGRIIVLPVQGFPIHCMWHAVHLEGKRLGLTASAFLDFLVGEGRSQ
ncbi:LysR family transcriptional regulator [Nitrosococcus wardiae]|uniref:LysR family transcriptional regulator n=1 Tax=Nitrosococcus wardiae TaxID=1814290 RepID=A0A4P7C6J5_9GAMM|nr:LysR family transcriptional regulator [Nitrosococcus wardiae]